MARNDGIDRTLARNRDLSANDIKNAQAHNEREKDMYSNPDIVPEETYRNIHFKQPNGSYTEMFDQLKKDGVISTRGLKEDATTYCELLFDVNSAYFYNHDTKLKKRLLEYAAKFPELCQQTDDDEQGGLRFEMDKSRISIRLTAPYSEERRKAASKRGKVMGIPNSGH